MRLTNMRVCIRIAFLLFLFSAHVRVFSSEGNSKIVKSDVESVDTLYVRNLLQSFEQMVNSDEEGARKVCLEALGISRQIGYKKGEGIALKDLGALYQYEGLYDSCRMYYTMAKEVFTDSGDTIQMAAVLANIASSYYDQGRYVQALAGMDSVRLFLKNRDYGMINAFADNMTGGVYLFQGYYMLAAEYKSKAREYFASVGDALRTADTDRDLGTIFSDLGENKKAIEAYRKCAVIYKEANDQRFLGDVYLNMGNTYTQTGNFDSARVYLNQGIKLLKTTGFTSEVANGEESMGYLAKQQGKYPEALTFFHAALKHADRTGDKQTLSSIQLNIAEVYLNTEGYLNAKPYLDSALVLARKMNSVVTRKNIHYDLFRFYQRQNALSRALHELIIYTDLKDSIYDKQKSIQLAEFEILHDMEQKRLVIKQQQADILILKKDNQIQHQKGSILSGMILFTLLVASFILFIIRNRFIKSRAANLLKVKEQQNELDFKKRELTSYALHLAQKNQLLEDLQKDIDQLKSKISDKRCYTELKNKMNFRIQIDKDWEAFRRHFEEVHPRFFADLQEKFPNLSNNDLRLLALLKMNLSSKEIALLLNITPDSVKKSRYRLRRKMDLDEETDIGAFINKIAGD